MTKTRAVLAAVVMTAILPVLAATATSASAASGSCPQYNSLLAANGLPVATFSRIMYRESRCHPGAYNRSGATGLLQIMRQWAGSWRLCRGLNLSSAVGNVTCAGRMYRLSGSSPWRLTR